jgi:hypothetical protein
VKLTVSVGQLKNSFKVKSPQTEAPLLKAAEKVKVERNYRAEEKPLPWSAEEDSALAILVQRRARDKKANDWKTTATDLSELIGKDRSMSACQTRWLRHLRGHYDHFGAMTSPIPSRTDTIAESEKRKLAVRGERGNDSGADSGAVATNTSTDVSAIEIESESSEDSNSTAIDGSAARDREQNGVEGWWERQSSEEQEGDLSQSHPLHTKRPHTPSLSNESAGATPPAILQPWPATEARQRR